MAICKIFIVDDSPVELQNLKKIIANAGYTVVTASSGKEAVTKAKADRPDLIFMDVIMEDADGFQACRSISKDNDTKNIPVVFVTSKNQKADRVWAELQGGKGYITKPYTPDQILSQINALN